MAQHVDPSWEGLQMKTVAFWMVVCHCHTPYVIWPIGLGPWFIVGGLGGGVATLVTCWAFYIKKAGPKPWYLVHCKANPGHYVRYIVHQMIISFAMFFLSLSLSCALSRPRPAVYLRRRESLEKARPGRPGRPALGLGH